VATCDAFSPERHHGSFLVRDLSAGGARLMGASPVAVGEALKLVLRIPHRAPLGVHARAVRRHDGPGGPAFAVEFLEVSAEDEDRIHQGIVAELERAHARRYATVLVVDPGDEVREALERELREMGREVVAVATPLEAVGWLTLPGTAFDTALVNLSTGAGSGVDVLDFLGSEMPAIRRIALGDDGNAFRLDLALRAGRAQSVMRVPWNRADLLGLFSAGGAAVDAKPDADAAE
jgi:CheY-like chemotaxis protein